MRRWIVSLVLLGLMVALGVGIAINPHSSAQPTERAEATVADDATTATTAPEGDDGERVTEEAPEVESAEPEAPPEPLLDRPLKVVSASWEWLAPAVLSGDAAALSQDAFGGAPLEVALRHVRDRDAIEEALARGGAEEQGADAAVLSLPELALSYERIRALDPRVVMLVGWSAGAHAVLGSDGKTLVELDRGRTALGAPPGSAELFVAGWVFERAGAPPTRLDVRRPGNAGQSYLATALGSGNTPEGFRVLTSTLEATALVPYVVVVPGGFADAHRPALAAFASGYLGGADNLHRDVPAAARGVAALDGSPQTVELVQRLGRVRYASLGDNARRFALMGRELINLEYLFGETWRIWRGLGQVSSPTPASPIDPSVVTALVLRDRSQVADPERREFRFDTEVILRESLTTREPGDIVRALGSLAGVFERSALRLAVAQRRGRPTAEALVRRAAERYGFDPRRVDTSTRPPRGKTAAIEVLAAP